MAFGIALAVSAAAGGRITETGLSLGTPPHMSPEQATAEKEIQLPLCRFRENLGNHGVSLDLRQALTAKELFGLFGLAPPPSNRHVT